MEPSPSNQNLDREAFSEGLFLSEAALKTLPKLGVSLRVMRNPFEYGKNVTADAITIYNQRQLDQCPGNSPGERYFSALKQIARTIIPWGLSDRLALISEPSDFSDGVRVGGYEGNRGQKYFPFGKMGQKALQPSDYLTPIHIPEQIPPGQNQDDVVATAIQNAILSVLTGKIYT